MAYLAKPFFFFLLLVLFFSLQIQARESKFFSKFTHISTKKISESKVPYTGVPSGPLKPLKKPPAPSTVPAAVPTPAPAPAFAPTFVENEQGYVLYGNVGSKHFTPTKGTETATDESDLLNEEVSAENYETGKQNSNYNNNVYTSNYNNNGYTNNKGYTVNYNNGYSNNFNTNGYDTEKQGISDTRFVENYETSNYNNNNNEYTTTTNNNGFTNNYNNNNGYSSNYNTNGFETDQKQGMSDTRSYLNGKYFYDVATERNQPKYEYGTQTEGYYGNFQNGNEFNTMEEYENKQGYQENHENYVP